MWTAIDWWNADETTRLPRQMLCDQLGWPRQYAEGEADHEWLTEAQYAQLKRVPMAWLDEIDAQEEA